MTAHGQRGHLKKADEEAKHKGSENSSLPTDPIHSACYGQAVEVGMSTTDKCQQNDERLNSIYPTKKVYLPFEVRIYSSFKR